MSDQFIILLTGNHMIIWLSVFLCFKNLYRESYTVILLIYGGAV